MKWQIGAQRDGCLRHPRCSSQGWPASSAARSATSTTGVSRRREHGLGNAVRVDVDGLYAQREAGEIGRHPEDRTVGALECEIADRRSDDVLEHAGAGIELDLPDVADGSGDRAGRVVALMLSASVTPAIETRSSWPSVGVVSAHCARIEDRQLSPTGSAFEARDRDIVCRRTAAARCGSGGRCRRGPRYCR